MQTSPRNLFFIEILTILNKLKNNLLYSRMKLYFRQLRLFQLRFWKRMIWKNTFFLWLWNKRGEKIIKSYNYGILTFFRSYSRKSFWKIHFHNFNFKKPQCQRNNWRKFDIICGQKLLCDLFFWGVMPQVSIKITIKLTILSKILILSNGNHIYSLKFFNTTRLPFHSVEIEKFIF